MKLINGNKEIFILAHEELILEYLRKHPQASWITAYSETAINADIRMKQILELMLDEASERIDMQRGNDVC